METGKNPMRTLSIGRAVRNGGSDQPMPAVSGRVSANPVAPNREHKAETPQPAVTHGDRLQIALIIPLAKYESFSKWAIGNIRIVKPEGWGGEVELHVLPDPGEDTVDFNQYGPPVTITLPKSSQV